MASINGLHLKNTYVLYTFALKVQEGVGQNKEMETHSSGRVRHGAVHGVTSVRLKVQNQLSSVRCQDKAFNLACGSSDFLGRGGAAAQPP